MKEIKLSLDGWDVTTLVGVSLLVGGSFAVAPGVGFAALGATLIAVGALGAYRWGTHGATHSDSQSNAKSGDS